jgi:mitochondrial fission protein ELM1
LRVLSRRVSDGSCERKEVRFAERWAQAKPEVEASLHHLDLSRCDALEPPWPDVVITIGRRPSMVALWVREQSGGRTRIVLLGKPSSRPEDYDLIVASSDFLLSAARQRDVDRPAVDGDRQARRRGCRRAWRPAFRAVPRPITAILVGGPTVPYVFDTAAADRIVALAERVVREHGTPCVVTSRRTPAAVAERLAERLPAAARYFPWARDAAENPYRSVARAGGHLRRDRRQHLDDRGSREGR